jgi:hypothetical protein
MGAKSEGLKEFAADLNKAAETVVEQAKKVVGAGCLNIKKDAQRIVRANSHRGYLPHYPRSISYDVTARGDTVVGEVGPDRAKLQGGLDALPILPRFERYVAELGEKLIAGQPGPGGPMTDAGG